MSVYAVDPRPPFVFVHLQGLILKDFLITSQFADIEDRIEKGRVITCSKGRIARFLTPLDSFNDDTMYHIDYSDTDITRTYKNGYYKNMLDVIATVQSREEVLDTISLFKEVGKQPDFVDVDLNALYKIFHFSYPGRGKYLLINIENGNCMSLVYDGYYGDYIHPFSSLIDEIEKRMKYFVGIKGIMVTGDVEKAIGLEDRLGISVEVMHPLRRIIFQGTDTIKNENRLSIALGLAI